MTASLAQQIQEVEYELDQRSKVYPRIKFNKPSRGSELDYHVKRLEAVLATLRWIEANEARIKAALAAQQEG